MNIKRLFFWGVLFGVLLLYVILFEYKRTPEVKQPEEDTLKVFTFTRAEIKGLQIIQDRKKVTMLKKGKSWQVTSPSNTQVQSQLIESLINAIVDVVNIEVIEENPVNLEQFGLKKPEIELNIILERKSKPITFFIGKSTPASVSMYAMIKGDNQVIMVGTYLRFSIQSIMDRF